MISYIKYRLRLRSLYRQRGRIYSAYVADIRAAKGKKSPQDDIDALESEARFEDDMANEEISIHITNRLVAIAGRRFIPIPPYDDDKMWNKCEIIGSQHILTNMGISHLRSLLRNDAKENAELLVMIVSALTGIIGTCTGLLAVIFK